MKLTFQERLIKINTMKQLLEDLKNADRNGQITISSWIVYDQVDSALDQLKDDAIINYKKAS